MSKINLIGVSESGISEKQQCVLSRCRIIVTSGRYRPLAGRSAGEIISITPVKEALSAIQNHLVHGDVGVLAGGDPLFFGIGRRLVEKFGPDMVDVFPGISSLQLACARFKIPWDDARVVSLHGRRSEHIGVQLLQHHKVIVFTDSNFSPDKVAGALKQYLELVNAERILMQSRIFVAENLGKGCERLVEGTIARIAGMSFDALNIMILNRPEAVVYPGPLGLKEQEIVHSRGLITKDEVRAVTLHKLGLPFKGVFWDIGSGSGSVSVEAARLCPGLTIFAVEKEEERLANIRRNIVSFETFNVIPVAGVAPDVLGGLPAPDRVFVGGSGGKLSEIVSAAAGQLRRGGRIVVNCVTEKTGKEAPLLLAQYGYTVEISEVRISRFGAGDTDAKRIDLNKITVVVGIQ
ncbi:MAG: precorrin-6y C5,15-methyltransferase (decarboxylating) subunit CbiE [Desulfobulbaceae bacterium]|nr:precorrin-6y C5,15-methyltransferase (decarboxylating) subunit CbiE [Desulfobulbaceae bacterium]